MRRTNLHLAEPQLERLNARARSTGLSVAELVRRAIDENYPPPAPEPRPDRRPLTARGEAR